MTKDMLPLRAETNVDEVARPNRMWQGYEEVDIIAPCKEKLQQLLSCCQDVAQIVKTLEAHVQLGRSKETPAALEVDGTRIEIILLQDELHRSKLHSEELEVAKMSLERKLAEMEERVQALTAQLMVYKEDFDLERQDRERAQGRLVELEQQLLMYQRSYESYPRMATLIPRGANAPHFEQSRGSRYQQPYYLSTELRARGRDVCDCYETDGVTEEDRKIWERPALACTVKLTEDAAERYSDLDRCSSVQLKAQSFNIQDFFPLAADASAVSAKPLDVSHEVFVEDGRNASETGKLCIDGVELPLPHTGVLASGKLHAFASPFNTDLSHGDSCKQSVASRLGKQLVHQDKPQQNSSSAISWSFLSKDEAETSLGNLNLCETDSTHVLPVNTLQEANLKCPKCRMSFLRSDHLLLLDHLEEC